MKRTLSLLLAAVMTVSTLFSSLVLAENNENVNETVINKVIAFPGAEGGGMYSPGARGALEKGEKIEVYHVTNLEDGGAGSFRDAVSKGNRIVVFDVSGNIDLKSNVNVGGSNMTILGQTAPGNGICFRGNNVKISGENVIVRYLRFRVGAHDADGNSTRAQDGLEITDNSKNIIVDHCSVSWGTDENLSSYAVKDVTIQWSIVAEALNKSVHDKGEHSYAAIWGGVNLTVHHNLIATHKSRNPKIGTSETVAMTEGYSDDQSLIDIRNNVFYNWGDKAGYGAENGAEVNIINNYYKPGPSTPVNKRARIFELSPGNKYVKNQSGKIYASGNVIDDDSTEPEAVENAALVNNDNWQIEKKTGVYLDVRNPSYEKLEKANEEYIKDYPVKTDTAQEAYDKVMADAGARLPKMDIVDERIINDCLNRTAPSGKKPANDGTPGSVGLVDDPTDAVPDGEAALLYDDRGYPKWDKIESELLDTDKDGIPDDWEDKMGLDKNNPYDGTSIGPNGYTWLEIYVEDITKKESGDVVPTVSLSVDNDTAKQNEDINITANITGSDLGNIEIYCDDLLKVNEQAKEGDNVFTLNNLKTGENYITAKVYNSKGDYSYSKVITVIILADKDPAPWIQNDADKVGFDGESYVLLAAKDGDGTLSQNLNGDFQVIAQIDEISKNVKDSYTGLFYGDKIIAKDYTNVFAATGALNGEITVLGDNYEGYNLLKIEKKDGTVNMYVGSGFADWKLVDTFSDTSESPSVGAFVKAGKSFDSENSEIKNTVSKFSLLKVITSNEQTAPEVKITNIQDNSVIGFSEKLTINIKPDSKAKVVEALVYFKNSLNGKEDLVNRVEFENGISSEKEESIPISFPTVAQGDLRVVCIDENLGTAEDKVKVSISADISPWKVINIGGDENTFKSYSYATQDYTYKIYAPDGNISGNSDTYGFMYQQFNDDMRLYFRMRPTGAKNFGLMLKNDLDADGVSYFFGVEPAEGGNTHYVLKARQEKGGEFKTIEEFNSMVVDKYFIITEKIGSKLYIYETSDNGADFYKTKNLITSVDTGLTDSSYYMGFAATDGGSGVPDTGWLAVESIEKGKSNSYVWNMNYGADWYWQMQEANVLDFKWNNSDISGNNTGKIVIKPDDKYTSERYIYRAYNIPENSTVENGYDILLTGEKTAVNVYFQTEYVASSAGYQKGYKVTFDKDGYIYAGGNEETNKIGEYNTSNWYSVKIKAKTGDKEGTAKITITDGNGVVAEVTDIPKVDFRTQKNVKKVEIEQGFYIEPVSSITGAEYYFDNMYVNEVKSDTLKSLIASVKEMDKSLYTKKSWLDVESALSKASEVAANDNADENDIETAIISLRKAVDSLVLSKVEQLVESKEWRFDSADFNALGEFSDVKEIDGLTLNPGSTPFKVNSSSGNFSDGNKYKFRLQNNGSGSKDSKYLKFSVKGKTKVWFYATSTSSTANRSVSMFDGKNESTVSLPAGQKVIAEFVYDGTEPNDLYLYSKDGANFYAIKYETYEIVNNEEPDPTPDNVLGDADGNGKVEFNDASIVLQYVLNLDNKEGFSETGQSLVDVDNDGEITALDASLILQKAINENFEFKEKK